MALVDLPGFHVRGSYAATPLVISIEPGALGWRSHPIPVGEGSPAHARIVRVIGDGKRPNPAFTVAVIPLNTAVSVKGDGR